MVVCVADSARKQYSLVKTTTKDNVEQSPGEFIKCGTVILNRCASVSLPLHFLRRPSSSAANVYCGIVTGSVYVISHSFIAEIRMA